MKFLSAQPTHLQVDATPLPAGKFIIGGREVPVKEGDVLVWFGKMPFLCDGDEFKRQFVAVEPIHRALTPFPGFIPLTSAATVMKIEPLDAPPVETPVDERSGVQVDAPVDFLTGLRK
jgi:hypothetical protein